jgi:NADH-ubiquinone oxidoreductase chain 2
LITIALAIKLGMPPFQFWVPQVIELVNIIKITLILVWQKIAPMVLICYSISNTLLVILMIRATIGSLGGLNQNNLKKIFFLLFLSSLIMNINYFKPKWKDLNTVSYQIHFNFITFNNMMLHKKDE